MVVDPLVIREAVQVERRIDAQKAQDAPHGASCVQVLEGMASVIVTAPHATEALREGRYRISDGAGTAALAHMLHSLCGVTAIYTQYRSRSDPNYYDDNDFKKLLAWLIELRRPTLLLDLHGSHDFRPFDVDLGTMHGASLHGREMLREALIGELHEQGIPALSDNHFDATRQGTVTRFASALGVPSIQLEVSSTWLRPSEGGLMAHRFAQLLQALCRYVQRVDQGPQAPRRALG